MRSLFKAMHRREARKLDVICQQARKRPARHLPLDARLQENRWKAKGY